MSDFNRHTYIERARLLLKQKRYRDAEQHAAAILQNNPEDADALQVIGHCRLDTGSYQEAIKIFERCLSIQPEDDYIHYLMAFAWYKIKVTEKAIHFLQSAISINPYASGYYGLFAYVMLDENRYDNALQKANEGLAVNAHDLTCLNARSHALFRLKNKEAAFDTIREALAVDPDDDFTHTNFGWHFMEAGKHKQAREHFRQALRINPNNDRARIGYKESLKANLPPYRWMLMFSLWLSAKSKAGRWAVIIVIWVSVKLLSGVSDAAGYSGFAYFLIGLYVLFVVFSWVGTSIANMVLLLGREGKYVLTKAEKLVAASVGVCLLFALVSALWGQMLPTAKDGSQFYIALVFATLTLPLSRFEHADRLKTKKYIWWYTIGLTALGVITALAILTSGPGNIQLLLMYAYLIGILVYTWAYSAVKI